MHGDGVHVPWTIVRDGATAHSVGPLHNAGFKTKKKAFERAIKNDVTPDDDVIR